MSNPNSTYYIHCDGGSRGNPGRAASAFVVLDANQKIIFKQGIYIGIATNNQAEYRAVVAAIEWLTQHNYPATLFLDSLLVVNQLIGKYKIKDQTLKLLANQIQTQITTKSLQIKSIQYVPRELNHLADLQVNATLDSITP
jgi:ribonuclease HI